MYELMFSDLDETLLTSDHHVPPINRQAIALARKKGLKFIPATGRGYEMTREILHELELDQSDEDYIIAFNGGMIVTTGTFQEVLFQGMEYALVKELFDFGRHLDVCMEIFTPEGCFLFHANQDEIDRKIKQKANFKVIEDFDMSFTKDMRIAKIIFQKCDMPYLREVARQMEPLTRDRVAVSYSSMRYLEFNAPGVNKGQALAWLAHYLGVPLEKTIAIGDNENDMEMIKTAGLGIAVQNALPDVKAAADVVTTKDFSQGAVAEVIERFVLHD